MKQSRREFLEMMAMALGGIAAPKTKAVESRQRDQSLPEKGVREIEVQFEQGEPDATVELKSGYVVPVYDVDGVIEIVEMQPVGRTFFLMPGIGGDDNNSGLSPDEPKRTWEGLNQAIDEYGTRCEPMTMVFHLGSCEDDDSPEELEAAGILPECTGTSWEVPSAKDLQEFDESGRWVSCDGGVTFARHSGSNPGRIGRIAYSGDSGLWWMTPEDERLMAGIQEAEMNPAVTDRVLFDGSKCAPWTFVAHWKQRDET